MARGTTLTVLLAMLKRELRDASDSNSYQDDLYSGLLKSKQSDLCNAYDWEFLERSWDVSVAAGDRYKTLPTTTSRAEANIAINFERPVNVKTYWNTKYLDTLYKITTENYNFRNSDLDQRQDPVLRWELYSNVNEAANPNQYEIWPIPATAHTIRFEGQRVPLALTAGSDTADLDDLLLVYSIAAEELALRDQKLAGPMANKAMQRLTKLRASYPTNSDNIVFGRNLLEPANRRKLVSVKIAIA